MRAFVIALGFMAGASAVFMAYGCWDHMRAKEQEIQRINLRITAARHKVRVLSELPRAAARTLDLAYTGLVNDMDVLARAHGLGCAVGVQGAGEGAVLKRAYPSEFEGIKEISVRAVFTGLSRELVLLSLLEGLSALERALPVIMRSVAYEKDRVSVELAIVGVL